MSLCHSERRVSAALRIPDGRKGQILMSFWAERQRSPENPAIGAFIIFLRFAGFLGKLGMTKKVGTNQTPNAHTPTSHVILSEAKPKRGTPDGRKGQILMSFWAERQRSPENPGEVALLYFTLYASLDSSASSEWWKRLSNCSMQGIQHREHRPCEWALFAPLNDEVARRLLIQF